jgi:hypothetical protein
LKRPARRTVNRVLCTGTAHGSASSCSRALDARARTGELGGLKNLCKLNLASTLVTDTGLVHLARLPALQELNLSGNEITDAGLVHLRGMHQLRHLNLDRTNVSDEGVAAIQRALPTLAVSSGKASPGRKGQGLARSLMSPRLK